MSTRNIATMTFLLLTSRVCAQTPAQPPTPPIIQALRALPKDAIDAGNLVLVVPSECAPPKARSGDFFDPDYRPAHTENEALGGMIDPRLTSRPSTPEAVAAAFGQQACRFGHVQAIAPVSIKALNTNADLAALPVEQLVSLRPLPFLLGTLSHDQWKKLTETGLRASDLSDDQQALLRAALPRPFRIVPAGTRDPDEIFRITTPAEWRDINAAAENYRRQVETVGDAELEQIVLHAYVKARFVAVMPDGMSTSLDPAGPEVQTDGAYKLSSNSRYPDQTSNETTQHLTDLLCPSIPNTLKPGDLNWEMVALKNPVSIANVKTIDQLVERVSKATGIEMYADPRYGKRGVVFVGAVSTQTACDLLQALSLCVGGTWRQVGPAYVLTDSVEGYGAQIQRISEITMAWSNRLSKASNDVGARLAALDWGHTLPFAAHDPRALTPALRDATFDDAVKRHDGHIRFGDLPMAVQAGAHHIQSFLGEDPKAVSDRQTFGDSLKPDSPVGVFYVMTFGLQLPRTGSMLLGEDYSVPQPATAAPAQPPMPTLDLKVALTEPVRGVLCAAQTSAEARMAVDKLADAGLNTLYLDVFHNGRAYFPNTLMKADSGDQPQVLGAAVAEGEKRHVRVVAAVDLLRWRADMDREHPLPLPVGYQEDVVITGETPWAAIRRRLLANELDMSDTMSVDRTKPNGWVSPTEPSVQQTLPALLAELAAVRGIAGIALQDTAEPGLAPGDQNRRSGVTLGYTLRNRLTALRASRQDPIDTGDASAILSIPTEGFQSVFPLDLPTFTTSEMDYSQFHTNQNDDFVTYLQANDTALLANCFRAIKAANPALPLLMRERKLGFTFDPWTQEDIPNDLGTSAPADGWLSGINGASVLAVPALYGSLRNAGIMRNLVDMERKQIGKNRQGGVLIDLVMFPDYDSLGDALDVVTRSVSGSETAPNTTAKAPTR